MISLGITALVKTRSQPSVSVSVDALESVWNQFLSIITAYAWSEWYRYKSM